MDSVIPITSLEPPGIPVNKHIRAIVTLLWPYSSSTRQCALLLAEKDFRLRTRKGQVRVRFAGASAQAVGKARLSIGDEVWLELRGANWAGDSDARIATPGKSVDGELVFRGELSLRWRRAGEAEFQVDVNVNEDTPPPASVESHRREVRGSSLTSSHDPLYGLNSGVYASPAFVRRARLSGEFLLAEDLDPFAELDADDLQERRRKRQRTSFGEVKNWKYAERTPSPEVEDELQEEETAEPASPETPVRAPVHIQPQSVFDYEPKIRDFQPAMPPPALPQLQIPRDQLAGEEISNSGIRPTTPNLHPVPSSSLPLPSPFPASSPDTYSRLTDTTFPHSYIPNVAMLSNSAQDETRATSREKASLSFEAEPIVLTGEDHFRGDDRNDDKNNDNNDSYINVLGYRIHPEYLSDTEEDEEMYADHLATQHSSVRGSDDMPTDLRSKDDHSDKDVVETSSEMHEDEEDETNVLTAPFLDPEMADSYTKEPHASSSSYDGMPSATDVGRHPIVASANDLPDTPARRSPPTFGFDGLSSTTTPQFKETPQSERERIMKLTYKSLFGFRASLSPMPTQPHQSVPRTMPAVNETDPEGSNIDIMPASESEIMQGLMDVTNDYVELEPMPIGSAGDRRFVDEDFSAEHDTVQNSPEVEHTALPLSDLGATWEAEAILDSSGHPEPHDLGLITTREPSTSHFVDDPTIDSTLVKGLVQSTEHANDSEGRFQSFAPLDDLGEQVVEQWIQDAASADAPQSQYSFLSTTSIATEALPPTEVPSFSEKGNTQEITTQKTLSGTTIEAENAEPSTVELGGLLDDFPVDISHVEVQPGHFDHFFEQHEEPQGQVDGQLLEQSHNEPSVGDRSDLGAVVEVGTYTLQPASNSAEQTIVVEIESSSPVTPSDVSATNQQMHEMHDEFFGAVTQSNENMQNVAQNEATETGTTSPVRSALRQHDLDAVADEGPGTDFEAHEKLVASPDASQHGFVLDPQLMMDIDTSRRNEFVADKEETAPEIVHRTKAVSPSHDAEVNLDDHVATPVFVPSALPLQQEPLYPVLPSPVRSQFRSTSQGAHQIPIDAGQEMVRSVMPLTPQPTDGDASGDKLQLLVDASTDEAKDRATSKLPTRRSPRKSLAQSGQQDNLESFPNNEAEAGETEVLTPQMQAPVRRSHRRAASKSEVVVTENEPAIVKPTPKRVSGRRSSHLATASNTPFVHTPASETSKRTFASRINQVPDAISAWFSPRRSSRLHPEPEEKENEAQGDIPKAAPVKAKQTKVYNTAHPATRPTRKSGTTTALAYFTPLTNLEEKLNISSQSYTDSTIDVLAVVTDDTKAPERAKSGPRDYFTIFRITDHDLATNGTVRVEVFRPWHAQLPVAKAGDAILLRGFVVKSRQRQPYILSADASAWCVWRHGEAADDTSHDKPAWALRPRGGSISGVREEVKGPPVELGEEERVRANELSLWWLETHADETDVMGAAAAATTAAAAATAMASGSTRELRHNTRREGKL